MRQAAIAALLLASIVQPPAFAADNGNRATAPLIPRELVFGNPTRTVGRISPDGQWLSWLAPKDGVLNIWVAPADDPSRARPVTDEKTRPIRSYLWSPDSAMVLYQLDSGGEENFRLRGADIRTGAQRELTSFARARSWIIGTSPQVPDRILLGINNRDPRWQDVYSLNLRTGALELVFRNDGYLHLVADRNLQLRLVSKPTDDGGFDYHRVIDGKVEAKPFVSVGFDDTRSTDALGFADDGTTLYWVTSLGRDKAALVAQDITSGETTVLGQSDMADVSDMLTDPASGTAQAYAVNHLRTDWVSIDPAVTPDLTFLKARLEGEIRITSRTLADDRWTVETNSATAPPATYLYDRRGRTLTRLFSSVPELDNVPLADMHPFTLRARDGLELTGYVSLPPGSDPDGDARPDRPLPLVLVAHGGPWARDNYGFRNLYQWLANRGYAVATVNFRGSTGFGKHFVNAGNREWGGKMQDDLTDTVDWAIREGIAARDKVAIMGTSYGGYATLAALAFTPERFACGIDIVGPSNLLTLAEITPPYWAAFRLQSYRRMGDPTTQEGRALLRERSPLLRADAIRRPLLVGHGANDPFVNVLESNQIVEAMKTRGIPVTYALFSDEGHGFTRPENNIAFMAIAENFLQPCLGGRAEPIGGALKGSSIRIEHGAVHVPGLEAAVAATAASSSSAGE